MKKMISTLGLRSYMLLPLLLSALAAQASDSLISLSLPEKPIQQASPVEFHGYVKADYIYDIGHKGSDVLNYQKIPMTKESSAKGHARFHLKQTRFNLKKSIDSPLGVLTGFIEGDFNTDEGNETLSNSTGFRLRHAYIKNENWLAGQSWSTFVDTKSYPEMVEFGNIVGQSLLRQPQLRYSHSFDDYQLMLSLENPEIDVRYLFKNTNNSNKQFYQPHDKYPDIIIRSIVTKPWGYLSLQAVGRRLAVENIENRTRKSTIGYGLALSGRINMSARDDLRFYLTSGKGMGRYLQESSNAAADVSANNLNQFQNGNFKLRTNKSYGAYLAYRHWWNESWRSNAGIGFVELEKPANTTEDNTYFDRSYHSAFINIFWQATKELSLGGEYLRGVRRTQIKTSDSPMNKESGDLERLLFSVKYTF